MFQKKYIAIDIGKTKILAAVVKLSSDGFSILEIAERKNPRAPKKIQKIILDYCRLARKNFWTRKVAISAAHLVDPGKKNVRQGKECYGSEVFGFGFLENEGFRVRVENDGRCFALGEYHYGKAREEINILALNLGTEIGGGFIIGGENYQGSHNSSLEVSHLNMDCGGQWSDWAGICGGKGIENIYRRLTKKKISAKEIFLEAEKNGKGAKEVIDRAAVALGTGIANLLTILDPSLVVIGGSLSKQKKFVERAVQIAREKTFNRKANYKFVVSDLGNRANLLGAVRNFIKND